MSRVLDDARLARYVLLALAAGAVSYGLWQFLKGQPPRSRPSLLPAPRDR